MVVMDERAPSFFEKFAVKAKKEPLVPIGALATVGFLVSGTRENQLKSELKKNENGQRVSTSAHSL